MPSVLEKLIVMLPPVIESRGRTIVEGPEQHVPVELEVGRKEVAMFHGDNKNKWDSFVEGYAPKVGGSRLSLLCRMQFPR